MLYFTSDLHLGHSNVIRFQSRPFVDVDDMNHKLIANINDTVRSTDELYILGDVSYRIAKSEAVKLLAQIKCKCITLVNGNHDKDWSGDSLFKEVCDYKELKTETGYKLVLFHYPIMDWSGKGHAENRSWALHLHGHIHSVGPDYNLQNFISGLYRYDVGVDANNYHPVSLDDILSIAK